LAAPPPDRLHPAPGQTGIHGYAIAALNLALRPFLARWHPLLKAWEAAGGHERDWPLAALCRDDLKVTQQRTIQFVRGLGQALGVPALDRLLPLPTAAAPSDLCDKAAIDAARQQAAQRLAGPRAEAAWRILVQLDTRIATQPLARDQGLLREGLASLHQLFSMARDELSALGPARGGAPASLNAVLLRLLNQHLRPVLATWHPRLSAWERANPERPEADWPEAEACRAALTGLRDPIAAEAARLRALLGLDAPSAGQA
jgi:hypothetical protein